MREADQENSLVGFKRSPLKSDRTNTHVIRRYKKMKAGSSLSWILGVTVGGVGLVRCHVTSGKGMDPSDHTLIGRGSRFGCLTFTGPHWTVLTPPRPAVVSLFKALRHARDPLPVCVLGGVLFVSPFFVSPPSRAHSALLSECPCSWFSPELS